MSHQRLTVRNLLIVFATLLILLALTIVAARHDLGQWNFFVAAMIASAKALLIGWYFMHVRQSTVLTRMAAVSGLLGLALLFVLSLSDYMTRDWLTSVFESR